MSLKNYRSECDHGSKHTLLEQIQISGHLQHNKLLVVWRGKNKITFDEMLLLIYLLQTSVTIITIMSRPSAPMAT
ncbi:hypothetical protein Y032_0003g1610 [Ancylostoma ceylanicum]|uniref:Uncharacterized protein n=1 Tax=Ancylostoma ceylanicum TaxID=53326 RepID=A0A016W0G1_9BILA|nr:hypothetical protein Y032_0003g1610 [Ancylostoma ceylanicum]